MQEYEEEIYNELNEYLNHQQSWVEVELGEAYFAIKEELDNE